MCGCTNVFNVLDCFIISPANNILTFAFISKSINHERTKNHTLPHRIEHIYDLRLVWALEIQRFFVGKKPTHDSHYFN